LKPGQERKELEGVFVSATARQSFEAVKTGIAGEKYFEVTSGLKEGDNGDRRSLRVRQNAGRRRGGQESNRRRARLAQQQNELFPRVGDDRPQAIWANKLRSFLTVLGNIVAVTSIIAVVSLIQGMNAYVSDTIVSGVGADNFTIQRMPIVRTEADEERVRKQSRITLTEAAAVQRLQRQRRRRRRAIAVEREPELRQRDGRRRAGARRDARLRLLLHLRRRARTADQSCRSRFEPAGDSNRMGHCRQAVRPIDPLDKMVKIGRCTTASSASPRKRVRLRKLAGQLRGDPVRHLPQDVRVPPVRYAAAGPAEDARSSCRRQWTTRQVAMRIERRLRPSEPDNFGMFSSDTLLGIYQTATRGIFAILVGVVSMSLVVGGIVIMNIMLMVVSERTREIGLRKALGARRRDIMYQILTESVTLSTFGGVVGTLLGFGVAQIISKLTPLPAAVQIWAVALGIGITAVVGLFFGLYPAMQASRLDPIEALRRE
jgi:putative ABC transport system permease protein